MALLGWAILGIIIGAAGTEFLRASKPELVEKVEGAAKRLTGCLSSSKSADDDAAK